MEHRIPGLAYVTFDSDSPHIVTLKEDLVKDLIGSSKKWTWGTELTSSDLKGLARGIDRFPQSLHSGYDSDLMTGSLVSSVSGYMDSVVGLEL